MKRYCWVVIMGALWELAGFAIKTVGSRNQQELSFAIWGQLFFLLAPLCKHPILDVLRNPTD